MGFPRSRDRLSCLPDCVSQAGFLRDPTPMTNSAKTCTRTPAFASLRRVTRHHDRLAPSLKLPSRQFIRFSHELTSFGS